MAFTMERPGWYTAGQRFDLERDDAGWVLSDNDKPREWVGGKWNRWENLPDYFPTYREAVRAASDRIIAS